MNVLTRKPAAIVKCQHCKWNGSARGLFTHVRMAHPNISAKPPTPSKEHPLAINGIGNLFSSSKVVVTNKKKYFKPYTYSKADKRDFLTMAGLTFAMCYILNDPATKNILFSEGVNPKKLVKALGRINELPQAGVIPLDED